ncbi:Uma2 family endonuclease [Pseudanabaena galeata UHCC 0370]|uniref:Uma2 family endonuclease n=1 Tax=Pseudanabaena galeata UHCC 0370 TaxID=3110310 RepID=A0ABU5TPY7_9CYAN|nr:Uma2 family endonuclease [Pseudanabaena galeata]MEA5479593.1 Uma2 family endonuclease [Pseudanabaena galeata UHCC 0370]
MILQIPPTKIEPTISWEALPDDFVLSDDPVENIQQPTLAAALTDALGAAKLIQSDMLIGSNFGLVATVNNKIIVKAPDWFYVPKVYPVTKGTVRRSYTQNIEGETVSVVMEFLSETECGELSVRSTPPYGKLYFYQQILQVPTYVTYDPYAPSLEVRCLENGKYNVQEPNAQGQVWIPELNLFLGIWSGERLGQSMNWLRWWDRSGNLLLWSAEQSEQEHLRAEQERLRADKLAAKLRELGIDPDSL